MQYRFAVNFGTLSTLGRGGAGPDAPSVGKSATRSGIAPTFSRGGPSSWSKTSGLRLRGLDIRGSETDQIWIGPLRKTGSDPKVKNNSAKILGINSISSGSECQLEHFHSPRKNTLLPYIENFTNY